MSSQVFLGKSVSLPEMLAVREERARIQHDFLKEYPQAALLMATMNIPGPVKNSKLLTQTFDHMIDKIKEEVTIKEMRQRILKTGSEFYAVVFLPPQELKEKMVSLEEESPVGRLFDLDVHFGLDNQSISRQEIGYPERKCLICQQPAKECGRARRHSVKEMQEKICQLLLEKE